MTGGPWYCVRQRAGPLVKECRAIRPRLSKYDTPFERTEKNKILLPGRDSSVRRSNVDRLELLLALFGYEGRFYTLTFEEEPARFQDCRKLWKAYLRVLKDHRGGNFDYVYLIEGRHGDRRYHLHMVLRDSDFAKETVRALWPYGSVDDEPLLLHDLDTYRRTAKYMCKEANDGVRLPVGARTWVASMSLSGKLPPPERFRSDSGVIRVPGDVKVSGKFQTQNAFGQYHYAWYIEPEKQTYIKSEIQS
jgi:hypothetical protein